MFNVAAGEGGAHFKGYKYFIYITLYTAEQFHMYNTSQFLVDFYFVLMNL